MPRSDKEHATFKAALDGTTDKAACAVANNQNVMSLSNINFEDHTLEVEQLLEHCQYHPALQLVQLKRYRAI